MSAEGCRATWAASPILKRAETIDAAFPGCACEPFSLQASGGDGVSNDELLARVLTSPDAYDEKTSSILTQKLMAVYSLGLSVIRQGAADAEILGTIDQLLQGQAEPRKLVGAILFSTRIIRSYDAASRWFGVYATDDDHKQHHVDIIGTTPAGSTSQSKKLKNERRYRLADDLRQYVIFADQRDALLAELRDAGF